MSRLQSPAIFTHFSGVSDPRRPNARRHELRDLIVIALCAAICGSESWADVERFGREKVEWFRRFLVSVRRPTGQRGRRASETRCRRAG